jgi:hypothetical protein
LLEQYCATTLYARQLDMGLRTVRAGTGSRYTKLMRQRRQLVQTATSLARGPPAEA